MSLEPEPRPKAYSSRVMARENRTGTKEFKMNKLVNELRDEARSIRSSRDCSPQMVADLLDQAATAISQGWPPASISVQNDIPARHIAGMQRQADADFLYKQAKRTEEYGSACDAIEFVADLVSKNTLVVSPQSETVKPDTAKATRRASRDLETRRCKKHGGARHPLNCEICNPDASPSPSGVEKGVAAPEKRKA